FRLLREMIEQRLQVALATTEGGADGCLYLGPKITLAFSAKLYFGDSGYEFSLVPTPDNRLVFSEEVAVFYDVVTKRSWLGSGHAESKLKEREDQIWPASLAVPHHIFNAVSRWKVYHFHDTSLLAGVRRPHAINDNEVLRDNAENIASLLYCIQQTSPGSYLRIREVVRLAAPFFDDFNLRPMPATPDLIQLEWR